MQGIKVCQGFRQDFVLQTPRPKLAPQTVSAIGMVLDRSVRTTDLRKLGVAIHPVPLADQFELSGWLRTKAIASRQR